MIHDPARKVTIATTLRKGKWSVGWVHCGETNMAERE